MSRKETTYNANNLKNVAEVLRLHRLKTPALIQMDFDNLDGLEKSIKKLDVKERKALEKFFGLLTQESSKYEQYCIIRKNEEGQDEVFWKKMPPMDFWKMQENAFSAVSKLQNIEFAYLYDSKTREFCDELLKRVQNKKDEDKGYVLNMLLVYNCLIRGGPNLYVDEDGMMKEDQEKENNFDQVSVLYRFLEELQEQPRRMVRIDLVEEFLDLLPEKYVKEIFWGMGINIPKNLKNVAFEAEDKKFWSFQDIRALKRKIFHKGPWTITEKAIMGKKVTLNGLRKIYRANREDFQSNYSLYLPVEDKVLPTGERVKQYSFATQPNKIDDTNVFSDMAEVITLKYWADHGLL